LIRLGTKPFVQSLSFIAKSKGVFYFTNKVKDEYRKVKSHRFHFSLFTNLC